MIRLEETESILEFENNESGNLLHSLLSVTITACLARPPFYPAHRLSLVA